jgi:hypothetical protein
MRLDKQLAGPLCYEPPFPPMIIAERRRVSGHLHMEHYPPQLRNVRNTLASAVRMRWTFAHTPPGLLCASPVKTPAPVGQFLPRLVVRSDHLTPT